MKIEIGYFPIVIMIKNTNIYLAKTTLCIQRSIQLGGSHASDVATCFFVLFVF